MTKNFIAKESEIPKHGDRVILEIAGVEICVFNLFGEYRAIANYCIHEAGPLCEGNLTGKMCETGDGIWKYENDGKLIECPWHSWTFDVETGENVKDDRYSIPTYDVEVEDGDIFVLM